MTTKGFPMKVPRFMERTTLHLGGYLMDDGSLMEVGAQGQFRITDGRGAVPADETHPDGDHLDPIPYGIGRRG